MPARSQILVSSPDPSSCLWCTRERPQLASWLSPERSWLPSWPSPGLFPLSVVSLPSWILDNRVSVASVRLLIAYVRQQTLNVSLLPLPPPKNMHVSLPFTSSETTPCRYSGEPIFCLASVKCLGEFKVRRRPLHKDTCFKDRMEFSCMDTACLTKRGLHQSTTRVSYHARQNEVAAYELSSNFHTSCNFFIRLSKSSLCCRSFGMSTTMSFMRTE
jgi:hypothetical protein